MEENVVLTESLRLKGMNLPELKGLLRSYSSLSEDEINKLSQQDLIEEILALSKVNPELKGKVDSTSISLKPSFYLLIIEQDKVGTQKLDIKSFFKSLEENNKMLLGIKNPMFKNFRLVEQKKLTKNTYEFKFTWQHIHWYLDYDLNQKNIYESDFGFSIIDFSSKKAIVTCHTIYERDFLIKILNSGFKINLNPLILTKPLLELIGSFDNVKKAKYFMSKKTADLPENITYSDENLASIPLAVNQERNPDSIRKESFYRIPLGEIIEQGVGVTSDSGKLWIPRKLTIDEIEKYAISLLNKISDTLSNLLIAGDVEIIANSIGLIKHESFSSIPESNIRNELFRLFVSILNMLRSNVDENSFTFNTSILDKLAPRYFEYHRLQLFDDEQRSYSYFRKNEYRQLKVRKLKGEISLVLHPKNEVMKEFIHPITGKEIDIDEIKIPFHLEFIPTHELTQIYLKALKFCSKQIDGLDSIISLPFIILNNTIRLDYKRALGLRDANYVYKDILPSDVIEFKHFLKTEVPSDVDKYIDDVVYSLGEKCKYANDSVCYDCTGKTSYLCLRSAIGHKIKHPRIINHKNIELCDIQGTVSTVTEELKLYGFAKIGSKKSLSLRNDGGSKLISQVLGQIELTDYNTVTIITPSILDDDILNRIKKLCEVFNKKLLILDIKFFRKLVYNFENDYKFDGGDFCSLCSNSSDKLKKVMKKYCT